MSLDNRGPTETISCFSWFNKKKKKTLFDILNEEFKDKNLDILNLIIKFITPTKVYTIIKKQEETCYCWNSVPDLNLNILSTDAIEFVFHKDIYRNEFNNIKPFIFYYQFFQSSITYWDTIECCNVHGKVLLRYIFSPSTLNKGSNWSALCRPDDEYDHPPEPFWRLEYWLYKSDEYRRLSEDGPNGANDEEYYSEIIYMHFLC